MKYRIVSPSGRGAQADDISLLSQARTMVEQGCTLYENSVKLTKKQVAQLLSDSKKSSKGGCK